ncbi:MAG: hypothetical protein H7A22_08770 [Spirochaetales bacterium]|nr:hypothetical protein [Spirochaetales bacterium]
MQLASGGLDTKPYEHPNVPGFNNAMLWFELVNSPEELARVLGPAEDPEGRRIRSSLDIVNYLDFVFMGLYTLLNAAFFVYWHVLNVFRARPFFSRPWLFYAGMLLLPVMLFGDVMETRELLRLSALTDPAAATGLFALQLWTRLKWAALAIACLHIGLSVASYSGRTGWLVLALGYTSAGMLILISIAFEPSRPLIEPASGLMSLAWLGNLVHAIVRFRRPQSA